MRYILPYIVNYIGNDLPTLFLLRTIPEFKPYVALPIKKYQDLLWNKLKWKIWRGEIHDHVILTYYHVLTFYHSFTHSSLWSFRLIIEYIDDTVIYTYKIGNHYSSNDIKYVYQNDLEQNYKLENQHKRCIIL
jgi:hypothetical protein